MKRIFCGLVMIASASVSTACGVDSVPVSETTNETQDITMSELLDIPEWFDEDESHDIEILADIDDVTFDDTPKGDLKEVLDIDIDIGTDVDDCATPQEGCPCDPELGPQECCVEVAKGLICARVNGHYVWTVFHDCGCWPIPECDTYPLYQLCE